MENPVSMSSETTDVELEILTRRASDMEQHVATLVPRVAELEARLSTSEARVVTIEAECREKVAAADLGKAAAIADCAKELERSRYTAAVNLSVEDFDMRLAANEAECASRLAAKDVEGAKMRTDHAKEIEAHIAKLTETIAAHASEVLCMVWRLSIRFLPNDSLCI